MQLNASLIEEQFVKETVERRFKNDCILCILYILWYHERVNKINIHDLMKCLSNYDNLSFKIKAHRAICVSTTNFNTTLGCPIEKVDD